jgi:hypothetical protein
MPPALPEDHYWARLRGAPVAVRSFAGSIPFDSPGNDVTPLKLFRIH